MFYTCQIANGIAQLDEEESRHLHTVLRYKSGDSLLLTDGKGNKMEATLLDSSKKNSVLQITKIIATPPERPLKLHLAIAPTKNIDRIEWLLEKTTEMGIDTITPIHCARSERTTLRIERLEKILIAAMKQSNRTYLPKLNPLTKLPDLLKQSQNYPQRYIACCPPNTPPHLNLHLQPKTDILALVGPEGDFSPEEIALAVTHGFLPVNLGNARLRTETAGLLIVASTKYICESRFT
jgi:16S rRNA (uracil1498-N3)-methyltransferase